MTFTAEEERILEANIYNIFDNHLTLVIRALNRPNLSNEAQNALKPQIRAWLSAKYKALMQQVASTAKNNSPNEIESDSVEDEAADNSPPIRYVPMMAILSSSLYRARDQASNQTSRMWIMYRAGGGVDPSSQSFLEIQSFVFQGLNNLPQPEKERLITEYNSQHRHITPDCPESVVKRAKKDMIKVILDAGDALIDLGGTFEAFIGPSRTDIFSVFTDDMKKVSQWISRKFGRDFVQVVRMKLDLAAIEDIAMVNVPPIAPIARHASAVDYSEDWPIKAKRAYITRKLHQLAGNHAVGRQRIHWRCLERRGWPRNIPQNTSLLTSPQCDVINHLLIRGEISISLRN